jgi:hypothetical protein
LTRFVTKSEIRSFAEQLTISEQASVRKSAAVRSVLGSTFLSHSSKDIDLVAGSINLLEGHGGTVYIDEVDATLPPYTNEQTAAGLKDRITQCRKFVLLATDNSKDSRWVPWELGIADGKKAFANIAILPESNSTNDDDWGNWEYIGLYRKIVWGKFKGNQKDEFIVLNSKTNVGVPLRDWLKE